MAIARYKYAVETVQESPGEGVMIDPDDIWGVDKNLEGSMGVLFHVMCMYGGGATKGLTVRVIQAISETVPGESREVAPICFDMPLAGSDAYVTVPVLLPEIAPRVSLQLVNNTGDGAWTVVWSRMIEGIEVG